MCWSDCADVQADLHLWFSHMVFLWRGSLLTWLNSELTASEIFYYALILTIYSYAVYLINNHICPVNSSIDGVIINGYWVSRSIQGYKDETVGCQIHAKYYFASRVGEDQEIVGSCCWNIMQESYRFQAQVNMYSINIHASSNVIFYTERLNKTKLNTKHHVQMGRVPTITKNKIRPIVLISLFLSPSLSLSLSDRSTMAIPFYCRYLYLKGRWLH